jgi:hypothetical protein
MKNENIKRSIASVTPIIWLPLYVSVVGPALAGPYFTTKSLAAGTAVVTGVLSVILEIVVLQHNSRVMQKKLSGLRNSLWCIIVLYGMAISSFHV